MIIKKTVTMNTGKNFFFVARKGKDKQRLKADKSKMPIENAF